MRGTVAVCALLGLFCGLGLGADAAPPAPEAEWAELTIEGEVVYEMPADVVRSIGLAYEDIPDEANAATYYIRAINVLPPLDWEDEALQAQYNSALDAPWTPDDGEFSTWFRGTEAARRQFAEAARMDECQFPVMVSKPGETLIAGIMLPYLRGLRGFGRLTIIAGHRLEHDGRVRNALDAYLVVFRAGRHARGERTLIDGLVGISLHAIASEAVTQCLARHDVSADVLEGLARALEEPDPSPEDRRTWIAGERAQGLQIARMSPAEWGALTGYDTGFDESERRFAGSRAFRIVWPDRTICRDFERFYDGLDELARMPTWEATSAMQDFEEDVYLGKSFKDWNILGMMLAPALSRAMHEYIRAEVRHEALRINVALRRFRAATGGYPETLAELVPTYLAELPPDPFTGAPFHYQTMDGEWLLYSLGQDQDDDGGARGEHSQEGDIAYWSDGEEGQEQ